MGKEASLLDKIIEEMGNNIKWRNKHSLERMGMEGKIGLGKSIF